MSRFWKKLPCHHPCVVLSCYGRVLSPNYKDQINFFRRSYKNLKISVTPKIHAVLFHIIEFCDSKGMGLSPRSEQASESVHHDFKQKWKNLTYKILTIQFTEDDFSKLSYRITVSTCKPLLYLFVKSLVI